MKVRYQSILQIGIHAIELLKDEEDKLHSRKLRTFNEPPF